MPPARRSTKTKRRRKRKQDERARRIRNVLIGGGLVLVVFIVVGMLTLHEMQVEEQERQKALQAAQDALNARSRGKAVPSPHATAKTAAKAAEPKLQLTGLKEVKIGLTKSQVQQLLGPADAGSLANLLKYNSLGIELALGHSPEGPVVEGITMTGPPPLGAQLPVDLAPLGVRVGDSPVELRALAPDGTVVYHQGTGTFTLYDPAHHVAVDFDHQAVRGVRQDLRIDAEFRASLALQGNQKMSLNQAFDSKMSLGRMLTDSQVDITVTAAGNGRIRAHEVRMRLKTDGYDPDSLKTMIKRQVNNRTAAGDLAVAVHVTSVKGERILSCDWYSPRYATETGSQPRRFGSLDSSDNISYRWY